MIQPTEEDLEANPEAQPTPVRLVPSMNQGPGHLWAIIKEFHQSNNKSNLFLLHSKIEKFQQDYKTSISAHIDKFTKMKNKLLH
jgi:hypothetical protein